MLSGFYLGRLTLPTKAVTLLLYLIVLTNVQSISNSSYATLYSMHIRLLRLR